MGGKEIRGERRPESEGQKLLTVVGTMGCKAPKSLGGDAKTYWGSLGTDNITVPCGPSGTETYLSPKGLAAKSAVDLIRAAEAQQAADFAATIAANRKQPASAPASNA